HTWKIVANNMIGSTTSGPWTFNTLNLPGTPANPTPSNNALINVKPSILDWDDAINATSYDVTIDGVVTNVPTSQISVNPADGLHNWSVVAKNGSGTAAGAAWKYKVDTTPPTAALASGTPTNGASTFDFNITYTDPTTNVKVSTLDDLDITVTGPNSFIANATFVGVDVNTNGTPRIATYRINAPGGTWDGFDNGTYSVNQNAGEVGDFLDNMRPAGAIGTFSVAMPVSAVPGTPDLISDNGKFGSDNKTNLDNTSAKRLTFTVGNTIPGALITLYSGGLDIGS